MGITALRNEWPEYWRCKLNYVVKPKFYRMLPLSLLLTLISSIFLLSEGLPTKRVSYKKKILVEKTFHRNWYAQGFAPDQNGPSVLHKRPFCNAFSGCGSGKRFFHSESTGCRKKAPKRVAGAPSNLSNNFKSERQWGGRGGFLLHSSYLSFF